MNRRQSIACLLLLSLISVTVTVSAQNKPVAKPTTTKTTKITPPKLTTSLGILSGTANAGIEQAKAILGTSLKVTDDKGIAYTITYYQLLYKQKIMSEDENTGKQFPSQKTISQVFKTTPLPDGWVKNISGDLAKGEELMFFDIIVKDKQGHLFYAPTLTLKIQ